MSKKTNKDLIAKQKLINEKLSTILNKNDYTLEKQIGFNFIFKKMIKYDKKN